MEIKMTFKNIICAAAAAIGGIVGWLLSVVKEVFVP